MVGEAVLISSIKLCQGLSVSILSVVGELLEVLLVNTSGVKRSSLAAGHVGSDAELFL